MKITSDNIISSVKFRSIIIISFFFGTILLSNLVKPYRGTSIYQYGSLISLITFLLSISFSFINTIVLVFEENQDYYKNIVWIILSAIPFLYVMILFIV
ncbi:hypothetical protein [Tenacibaculum sp. M341]|uniref:hypothetical protein n=1 Tax=Tenacibaculum sp. M341 TaxID=2530339 RepID=UPI00104F28F4|nr:hypothetical protein [Tenacibaculum sp. M341]TCI84827.1 hypothetical protein EYW44_19590 [Tenacibaculum sp. M341]